MKNINDETLDAAGSFANEGKMVDASFVEAPRQRNTREEPRSAHEFLLNKYSMSKTSILKRPANHQGS